jgi:hypothetical protein
MLITGAIAMTLGDASHMASTPVTHPPPIDCNGTQPVRAPPGTSDTPLRLQVLDEGSVFRGGKSLAQGIHEALTIQL